VLFVPCWTIGGGPSEAGFLAEDLFVGSLTDRYVEKFGVFVVKIPTGQGNGNGCDVLGVVSRKGGSDLSRVLAIMAFLSNARSACWAAIWSPLIGFGDALVGSKAALEGALTDTVFFTAVLTPQADKVNCWKDSILLEDATLNKARLGDSSIGMAELTGLFTDKTAGNTRVGSADFKWLIACREDSCDSLTDMAEALTGKIGPWAVASDKSWADVWEEETPADVSADLLLVDELVFVSREAASTSSALMLGL
jgi:hypothetical protein